VSGERRGARERPAHNVAKLFVGARLDGIAGRGLGLGLGRGEDGPLLIGVVAGLSRACLTV
jgi:hypothetical protein